MKYRVYLRTSQWIDVLKRQALTRFQAPITPTSLNESSFLFVPGKEGGRVRHEIVVRTIDEQSRVGGMNFEILLTITIPMKIEILIVPYGRLQKQNITQ